MSNRSRAGRAGVYASRTESFERQLVDLGILVGTDFNPGGFKGSDLRLL